MQKVRLVCCSVLLEQVPRHLSRLSVFFVMRVHALAIFLLRHRHLRLRSRKHSLLPQFFIHAFSFLVEHQCTTKLIILSQQQLLALLIILSS